MLLCHSIPWGCNLVYVCVCVCVCVCMFVFLCVYVKTCMYMYVCVYVVMYVRTYVCMYLWTCMYMCEIYPLSWRSYFHHIQRIGSPDYIPTVEDLLRSRVKTLGIVDAEFSLGSFNITSVWGFVFVETPSCSLT